MLPLTVSAPVLLPVPPMVAPVAMAMELVTLPFKSKVPALTKVLPV
jgi:hypothetical protein